MSDTNQLDLAGKKLPDVSKEEETKFYEVYRTKNLRLSVQKDALDKLFAALDKKLKGRKINESDKDKLLQAWVQSKARLASSKHPLTEGLWDKETKQLCDEIMGE